MTTRAASALALIFLSGWAAAMEEPWDGQMARIFLQLGQDFSLSKRRAEGVIAGWPEEPAAMARKIMSEYGPPDQVQPLELVWYDRKPFMRMAVYADAESAGALYPLVQMVAYAVTPDRLSEIEAFERGVVYDVGLRAFMAGSGSEGTNLLALNLAEEIARGVKSAQEARAFYDKTLGLAYSGKSSRYMRRLLFKPQRQEAGK